MTAPRAGPAHLALGKSTGEDPPRRNLGRLAQTDADDVRTIAGPKTTAYGATRHGH